MDELSSTPTDAPPIRQAARVLLLDRDGRVLLFRFVDPVSAAPFWITPGGGLDEGESFEDAARRELREETGIIVDAIPSAIPGAGFGPCVWTRTIDIRYGQRRFRQHERYYPLRLDASRPPIDTGGMLDYEVTDLAEHRWWSAEQITASEARFAPSRLAALLPTLLNGQCPDEPMDVGR